MRRIVITIAGCVALIVCVHAGERPGFEFNKVGGFRKTTNPVAWSKRMIQGFAMQVWLNNEIVLGNQASQDPRAIGLDYPAGERIEHLFGGGPIIGGVVNGQRRVTAAYWEGTQEFDPEIKDTLRDRLWIAVAADTLFDSTLTGYYKKHMSRRGFDDDGDGKVDEDELDGLDNDGDWNPLTDDIGADGVPDSLEVGCKGAYDPVNNPDPAFDDYAPAKSDLCHQRDDGTYPRMNNKDKYTEKNGLPDHGEPHVDEDYGALSDHDVYFAATDTFKNPAISTLLPLGIKVWAKSYAFLDDQLKAVLPFDYYFVNVGKSVIKDVYLGWDADMDLGPLSDPSYVSNDYCAYLPKYHTAYMNNSKDRGSTPLGITILGTRRPLDSLQFVFRWWEGGNTVQDDSDQYAWLDCEAFGGNCIEPDQPQSETADMRLLVGFGPVGDMQPGDTVKLSCALVSGTGIDDGPNPMVDNIKTIISLYQNGYHRPATPISPCISVTPGFRKNTIQWGRNVLCSNGHQAIDPMSVWDDSNKIIDSYPPDNWRRINPPQGHTRGGRIFEGYRLYRSEDPTGLTSSFTLLKEYDLTDEFPPNVGFDSVFVDSNLVRGKTYWYAVTSFGIPDRTILTNSTSPGVLRYDTLYTTNPESPIDANKTGVTLSFSASNSLGQVLVVPNPYRVDQDYTYESGGWEGRARDWTENNRKVKFIHLPPKCTIRVFTLTGDLVTTIDHNDPVKGEEEWNLLSQSNRALASGVYVYSVESDFGRQVGKFVLIR